MHISTSDTRQFGIGWLDQEIYGEGGFFIMFGKQNFNFWTRPQWVMDVIEERQAYEAND